MLYFAGQGRTAGTSTAPLACFREAASTKAVSISSSSIGDQRRGGGGGRSQSGVGGRLRVNVIDRGTFCELSYDLMRTPDLHAQVTATFAQANDLRQP